MSWQAAAGMGMNPGNGLGPGPGGGELGAAMHGNPSNQPPATEYTLQGKEFFWASFRLDVALLT